MNPIPVPGNLDADTAAVLLSSLIEIPSVNPAYDPASPGEVRMTVALGELCERLGCAVDFPGEVDGRRNVRARLASAEPRFTLLIEGHTDTVSLPAGESVPRARIDGGRVHGRGACDVKGGLTAALLALAHLAEHRPRQVDVVLLGAIDEEHHFRGVTEFLARGERPDASIVLEPTESRVVNAHNGVARLELLVHGDAGHTSLPPSGRNAIADAAAVMDFLTAWHQDWTRQETAAGGLLTVTMISGGSAINIVPQACRISLDIRVAPKDDPEALLEALTTALATLGDRGIRVEVDEVLLLDGGMFTDPQTPLVRAALTAAGQPEPAWVPFGTDGSKLARAGVPTIVFGPGSIAQAHGNDEWVRIDDVVRAAHVLIETVRLLDGQVTP